jgi:hypothetical protein
MSTPYAEIYVLSIPFYGSASNEIITRKTDAVVKIKREFLPNALHNILIILADTHSAL